VPPQPKAILFDLDDTILTFGDRRLLLIEVAEEFAADLLPHTPIEVGDALEDAYDQFWRDESTYKKWRFRLLEARTLVMTGVLAGFGLSTDIGEKIAEQFHLRRDSYIDFFPGALETIHEFRRRGVKLALVTNGLTTFQRAKIDRFELAPLFDHIQIEEEAGFGKPDEQAYTHAMTALGVTAKETWMVGDNLEWEVAAPQRLGIYSIWHDHLGLGLPPNSLVKPDRIIRTIAELI